MAIPKLYRFGMNMFIFDSRDRWLSWLTDTATVAVCSEVVSVPSQQSLMFCALHGHTLPSRLA
jgi:hypothetical protein